MKRKIRIIMAKPGLDGHDRGAKVVARALRDAGHEVIYTGLRRTPEEIIRIVEDEDASILGLSSLSGAHGFLFPRVCELLKENGLNDVVVFGFGDEGADGEFNNDACNDDGILSSNSEVSSVSLLIAVEDS